MEALHAAAIEFPARREALAGVIAVVEEFCVANAVDAESAYALRLVVEEVCLNLIDYGYAGTDPATKRLIGLRLAATPVAYELTVLDRGRPFDPANAPAPDLQSPAETRPVGGLGWHLVRHMVDELSYRSDALQGNQLRLVRRRRPVSIASGGQVGNLDQA